MKVGTNNFNLLILSLFLPFGAGLIGALINAPVIPYWYAEIAKPTFNPPDWVFGPVWTILYILMGVSLYLVWSKVLSKISTQNKHEIHIAVTLFIIHLFVNVLWNIVFFNLQNPSLALTVITALVIMVIILIAMFFRISKTAAYLLVPYLAWISFATILNFAIWQLNI